MIDDETRAQVQAQAQEAKHIVISGLQTGLRPAEIEKQVDRYLRREHWKIDEVVWAWRVITPWRGGVMVPWGLNDVGVEIWERSAIERLAELLA